jgi:stearoyl-CoA desaturase (delta-9 desaturase)
MNILRASTKAISYIQLVVMFTAIAGLFVMPFTPFWLLVAFICYNLYSSAGISMMYHRFWTHKSFEFKFDWMKWPFTLLACLVGKGSPLAWVYVHRLHHANADTENDPHSPHYGGFRIMGFKSINLEKLKVFIVRDMLNKEQKFLNDWYLGIIIAWATILLLISPSVFYFCWVLPVAILQVAQDLFNYFAHTHGYRNFETKDTSTNNFWLWPLILGEAWHNNHHGEPKAFNFAVSGGN